MRTTPDFGDLAFERGFASKHDLEHAAEEQRRRRKHGKRPLLGEVLVELGRISLEQLFHLLDVGHGYREREQGDQVLFGDVAVRKGYVTPIQLFGCLQLQRDEDLSGMPHRPIGEILADQGYLAAWELEDVRVTLAELASGSARTGETPCDGFKTAGGAWREGSPTPPIPNTWDIGPATRTRPSRREEAASRSSRGDSVRVANIMSPIEATTTPYARASAALEAATAARIASLLVLDGEDLAGMVSVEALREASPGCMVLKLMTPAPPTVDAHMTADEASRIMSVGNHELLPVMAGSLVVGIVTRADLARAQGPLAEGEGGVD
jgi:CBS domain-containing protein